MIEREAGLSSLALETSAERAITQHNTTPHRTAGAVVKRCVASAERQESSYSATERTTYVLVRYGTVLGASDVAVDRRGAHGPMHICLLPPNRGRSLPFPPALSASPPLRPDRENVGRERSTDSRPTARESHKTAAKCWSFYSLSLLACLSNVLLVV